MEHITTSDAVDYVMGSTGPLAASITTHHLVINRNHILVGGIKPHYYCLPVAKRETHRLALRTAATSGDPRFFLGTDTAPHLAKDKLAPCGCAGCFTAMNTMPILAHIFDEDDALDRLEDFTSRFGAEHYGQELNSGTMTLIKEAQAWPDHIDTVNGPVHVFDPAFDIAWRVAR
jgi:dihydroorotase